MKYCSLARWRAYVPKICTVFCKAFPLFFCVFIFSPVSWQQICFRLLTPSIRQRENIIYHHPLEETVFRHKPRFDWRFRSNGWPTLTDWQHFFPTLFTVIASNGNLFRYLLFRYGVVIIWSTYLLLVDSVSWSRDLQINCLQVWHRGHAIYIPVSYTHLTLPTRRTV